MGFVEEKIKEGLVSGAEGLVGDMKLLKEMQEQPGIRKTINSELWHACAGPLVSLPQVGSLVYYFPQGHSEQVAVSTKQAATSQIPNYPNLPSQLMCQVHSITMHADKETDEVYAQTCLQPVISENDVLPVPDFVLRPNKHPTEFFCKTLTASDTSTHGGFSVPRRAAEKLFPPLDYTMQPPTQELIVNDLHNTMWTFRHIYRGQPKRHLLTTGWSMFVGAKRLKAGDAVIFIRDERSQLLLGIRRANRQQTTLPCSVISADSMHIGVLAAASHAAANRSPFTIFYNPRACSSEFVVPVSKYQKSVYGTQLSVGGRFGMMFETEDSSKRRYMGTIVGISDLDHLRWPGSKWRSLQVEWDDPGCDDRQSRVSPWEIETPESLFIFPSFTSTLKRPLHPTVFSAENEWGNLINKRHFTRISGNEYNTSTPNLSSEQLLNLLMKPQLPNHCETVSSFPHEKGSQLLEVNQNTHLFQSQSTIQFQNHPCNAQSDALKSNLKVEEALESSIQLPHPIDVSRLNPVNPSLLLPNDVWNFSSDFQFLPEIANNNVILPSTSHEMWDFRTQFTSQNPCQSFSSLANSSEMRDLSDETNQSGIYYSVSNGVGSGAMDPSSVLNDFGTLRDSSFQNPSDCLAGNFSSSQEVRSQMTSVSLPDSQAFCKQDLADTSGVTSSSNVDFHESALLQNDSWKQVSPPIRTYTKVQKAGSVGRSIDVAVFMNYDELCCAIERMFGLEGLLNDPRNSGWKLVYVDYENDVLLVGDDPWGVFVRCVKCIRILSPSEVQQMSEEGMQLLNNAAAMQAALP